MVVLSLVGALLLLMSWVVPVEAKVITAASCSRADVDGAINGTLGSPPGPAVDGDIVQVPAGTCVWLTRIIITNKAFSLIGNGMSGPTATIIDVQDPINTSSVPCGIDWITTETTPIKLITRLSGFRWISTAGCPNGSSPATMIRFRGTSTKVRYDYNYGAAPQTGVLSIHENARGVGDHNIFEFLPGGNPNRHLFAHMAAANGGPYGDISWATDSTWGTDDAFVLEDNQFNNLTVPLSGVYATDASWGSRTVFRFNTFKDTTIQVHGTESNGRLRGYRTVEYYRNLWDWSSYTQAYASIFGFRGGSFRAWDNRVEGAQVTHLSNMMDMTVYRRGVTNANGWLYPNNQVYVWGPCGVQTTLASLTRDSAGKVTVTTNLEHGIHFSGSYIQITNASDASFNTLTFPANPLTRATRICTDGSGNVITCPTVIAVGSGTSTLFSYQTNILNTPVTINGTGAVLNSPFDGNTDSTGYPCMDQVGRGKSPINYSHQGSASDPLQPSQASANALEPAYVFHNIKNGALSPVVLAVNGTSGGVVVANRDFYNETVSPVFNGANGIGRGLRINRPSTCTTGHAYFATNGGGNWNTSTTETLSAQIDATYSAGADGALDICVANAWVSDAYVPLIYPHPLVTTVDTTPPGAPTGVRIQ